VKTPNQPRFLQLRVRKAIGTIAAVLGCLLILAFAAGTANAQTFQNAPTVTELFAGVQNVTVTGPGGLTVPTSGVVAHGTAISQFTNGPLGVDGKFACQEPGSTTACNTVRHIWYGDAINGLCRIDPEVDAPLATPVNGFGAWNVNALACVISINKLAIAPGQITYDSQHQLMYLTNNSRVGAGIARIIFHPEGDNGQGMVDLIQVDSLIGTQIGRNAFGGCGQLANPKTGSPVPRIPDALALGPDGDLYAGDIRDGAILRIVGAATFNPQTDCPPGTINGGGFTGQDPTQKIQIPILSHDILFGAGHTFGLGFIGDTLIGADNIAPWVQFHATQCLTPVNGNTTCGSPVVGGAPLPNEILASAAGAPQGGLASDAQYPFFPGNAVYVASFPNLTRVTNILSASQQTANLNYGGSFSFLTGVTADPQDPANATVWAQDDETQGGINGTGRLWRITPAPAAPGPPSTPAFTSAAAGPGTGQATLGWVPTVNGQPTTSYDISIWLASPTGGAATPSGLPDAVFNAPAQSATISGLTSGIGYQFEIEACNAAGCSAFSPLSSIVTPFTTTVPAQPTGVVGVNAGDGSTVAVAWTEPSNGHSPVTSSAVTVFTGSPAVQVGSPVTLLGAGTGTSVTGLACGPTTSYQFSVTATNAVGTSVASALSAAVPNPCATNADVSASETVQASSNAGAQVTYTITIHNNGPAVAPSVGFSDTLPAGYVSSTFSQGICTGTGTLTTFNCALGAIPVAGSATVTVTVLLPNANGSFTNSATVNVTDPASLVSDGNLTNNTFSATTTVGGGGGCTASAADVQVVGSSNNGNPPHGSPVTFTWQIKNGTGSVGANCVNFTAVTTAPSGATLLQNSFTTTQGTCSIDGSNNLSCNLGNIAGGGAATVTVQATPSAAEPANSYSTTGSATSTGSDPNTANNSSTVHIGAQ
jgi:uncharacterized repeat protein (TIGR01451 family)